jgi:hypothetical protein
LDQLTEVLLNLTIVGLRVGLDNQEVDAERLSLSLFSSDVFDDRSEAKALRVFSHYLFRKLSAEIAQLLSIPPAYANGVWVVSVVFLMIESQRLQALALGDELLPVGPIGVLMSDAYNLGVKVANARSRRPGHLTFLSSASVQARNSRRVDPPCRAGAIAPLTNRLMLARVTPVSFCRALQETPLSAIVRLRTSEIETLDQHPFIA